MTTLKIGDQAPAFEGIDQQGNAIRLVDFKGKKVVLYFYPKDSTPGCTMQACNLRDNYEALQQQGYVVIGISKDSAASHQRFIDKHQLPFPLMADEDKHIHEQYGTWVQKSLFGVKYWGTARVTFVIDETGHIADIIAKVKTRGHAAQILS